VTTDSPFRRNRAPSPSRVERFLAEMTTQSDLGALSNLFCELAASYGFDFVRYLHLSSNFRRIPQSEALRAVKWPKALLIDYIDRNCFEIDPAIERGRRLTAPFRLHELEQDETLTTDQTQLIREFRRMGVRDAMGVPVTARPGDVALFCLATTGDNFSISPEKALELQGICHNFHNHYTCMSIDTTETLLSSRETEVLEMIALRYSNCAIAQSLGVSSNTVDTHVRRCFEKLGVTTRVEAVLIGIGRGLIIL